MSPVLPPVAFSLYLMLVWALWLAAALLRWLRLAWVRFSTGGCFRRGAKKKPAVPPPLAPPA